jgi:hypothetical protein
MRSLFLVAACALVLGRGEPEKGQVRLRLIEAATDRAVGGL